MPGLADTLLLTRLLAYLRRPPLGDAELRASTLLAWHGAKAMRCDVYRPQGEARASVIALHGVTAQGGRDARLCHLGHSLARVGITCYLPTLPGLSSLGWDPADLDHLAKLVKCVARPTERVALLGFSHGASYALLTGARPEVSEWVRAMVSFGAYHCLRDLRHHLATALNSPQNERQWDDAIYLKLTLLARSADSLEPELRARVDDLLARYCSRASLDEKRAFYHRHLARLDAEHELAAALEDDGLRRLSPAGQLTGVRCPVALLHDPHDFLVPAEHAARIHGELLANPGPYRHRLLVTPLISHVSPGRLAARDLVALYDALGLLVAGD